jgi:hypothetical protein
VRCSRIGGNDNVDENNAPTDGAAIYAGDDASAQMENVILEGNTGHEVIRGNSAGDGVGIVLQDSLVADNSVASAVIRTNGESPVTLRRLTIAGNSIGGSYVLDLSDAITLESSIVYQPGFLVTAPGGGTRDIEDVLANEIDSINTGQRLLAAVPRFVDPAGSDYHLRAASPAVDYAPTSSGYDLEGQPRGVDLALVANIYGASDLGAYERQQIGNLLHNPYFKGNFHFWEVITPDAVSYSAQNYATPATGSAYVNYAATDVYALTQCVHLPGPGTYALSGTGYSPGFTRLDHDQLFLDWQLRFAGSEACNAGAPEQGGELFVAGTGSWTTSDPPAIIAITPEQWTQSSSVAVFLKVHDTGVTAPSASGYFDNLSLVPAGDSVEDRVFADDFEGP